MKKDAILFLDAPDPMVDPEAFANEAMDFLVENTGPNEKVISPVSGGTDSSVAAELLYRGLGDNRVVPVHVNLGYMRRFSDGEESELVARQFGKFSNFTLVDASKRFHDATMGIEDSEEKRKAFQVPYVDVFSEVAGEAGCPVLCDGGILPDRDETTRGIKTHHNPMLAYPGIEKRVEPLASLTKDRVRRVALYLGLSKKVALRKPFPGPGLMIRTVGVITSENLEVEREANRIVEGGIDNYFEGNYGVPLILNANGRQTPFQNFAATFGSATEEAPSGARDFINRILTDFGYRKLKGCYLLSTRVTGIRNGERNYEKPLCIEVHDDINPNALDMIGSLVPAQFPVSGVLCTLSRGGRGKYSVAIRCIDSTDVGTADVTVFPNYNSVLRGIANEVLDIPKVNRVLYDISPKPPRTVEYE